MLLCVLHYICLVSVLQHAESASCKLDTPVEVQFLVDSTDGKVVDKLVKQGTTILKEIRTSFPQSSISVAAFSTKLYFGIQHDESTLPDDEYCYKNTQKMTSDLKTLEDFMENIETSIPKTVRTDEPGSQLDALFYGAKSSDVGWTDDTDVLRVSVLITGHTFHNAGDLKKMCDDRGDSSEACARPHDGRSEPQCAGLDFPTVKQVKDALVERNATPLIIMSKDGSAVHAVYKKLLEDLEIGGALVKMESEDLRQAVDAGLSQIACSSTTTTTTTTATTTTTTTTINVTSTMGITTLTTTTTTECQPSECREYAPDFMLTYDLSTSYEDDLATLRVVAPKMFNELSELFPHSRFGVASFSDKAAAGLGNNSTDVCYRTNLPLTKDVKAASNTFLSMNVLHGGDDPEAQLDALFHGAMSSTVGWREEAVDEDGRTVVRVMVLATDADYHMAGDFAYACRRKRSKCEKKPFVHDGSTEPRCTEMDYPTIAQVSKAFKSKNIKPLFLIADNANWMYEELIDLMGITGGAVVSIKSDSSNIIDAIKEGLLKVVCGCSKTGGGSNTGGGSPTTSTTTTTQIQLNPMPPKSGPKDEAKTGSGVIVGAAMGGVATVLAAGVGAYVYNSSSSPDTVDVLEEFGPDEGLPDREVQISFFDNAFE